MAFDWLLGPRVKYEAGQATFGSSYVITLSDVNEICELLHALGAESVEVLPTYASPMYGPWGRDVRRDAGEVALTPAISSLDLEGLAIEARWPEGSEAPISVDVRVGSRIPGQVSVGYVTPRLEEVRPVVERIVAIILTGRRRAAAWKLVALAKQLLWLVLVALAVAAAVATWPNAVAAVAISLGVLALGMQLGPRIDTWVAPRPGPWRSGVIVVDPTDREKVRRDRANERRDLKVGAISALAGAAATALLVWIASH